MSNDANSMSLEAAIVQRIKGMDVYTLITDEDTLEELVKKAMREVLQIVTLETDRYGDRKGYINHASPAARAAHDVIAEVAKTVTQQITDELMKDEKFVGALREFIAQDWIRAIRGYTDKTVEDRLSMIEFQSIDKITNLIRSRQI